MKKQVLYYGFQEEDRRMRLITACRLTKTMAREVRPEELECKAGYLAGLPGFDAGVPGNAAFAGEVVLLCGFSSKQLEEMLAKLRALGLGNIAYKAVLTEHNKDWRFVDLAQEIRREHETMNQ